MRQAFIKTLTEIARDNKEVILLTGDLGFNLFEEFSQLFPEQFLNMGVAEANMIGVASGLALSGKLPFVYSIATFATMRPYEQIRSVALHNAHVVIVGSGAGYSYGPAGPTHHALEDISLMRSLPNMSILCPADPLETAWATHESVKVKGPVYLRLGKIGEPLIHKANPKLILGQGVILQEGRQVAIMATGNMVANAILASEILKKQGITSTVISMHTVKPLDGSLIRDLAKKFSHLVTVEEHFVTGGLGSAVSETMSALGNKTKLLRLGIPDVFTMVSGSQDYLRQKVDLHPQGIAKAIRKFLS